MTIREKVILGASGGVCLWGIWSFLGGSHDTESGPRGRDHATDAAAAFVATAEQQLAESRLSDAEVYVVRAAQIEWQSVPRDHLPIEPKIGGKENDVLTFSYRGYVHSGNEVFAIINGTEYREGEALKEGGRVLRVTEKDVRLERNGNVMTIPFEHAEGPDILTEGD